jgi:phosphate transport system ATP-binding protein
MSAHSHLRTENLSVSYGSAEALKNINVSIPDRQITAIIGPSGCGKSTLLKSFNRLLEENDSVSISGKVLVNDEDIYGPSSDVTRIRKKMGLLSQRPFPLPMSIYDNVAFGPRIHGARNRGEMDSLVEKFLTLAGLWDEVRERLDEPASRLSIGQQQRLCLARGLAVEPEIILADEPTSALDPHSSRKIEEEFKKLKRDYTIVVVTHILRQARRLADYIIFIYLGEIIEHGPSHQIFENPKEGLTREYIQGIIS